MLVFTCESADSQNNFFPPKIKQTKKSEGEKYQKLKKFKKSFSHLMISLRSGFYVFKVSDPNICLNIDSISICALMSCVVFTDVPQLQFSR